jgi:hypothetical protein
VTNAPFAGEMKVTGDEMIGQGSIPYTYTRGSLRLGQRAQAMSFQLLGRSERTGRANGRF